MSLLAFTYDDYYCYGIKNSFRGIYDDEEELFQLLRGDRHGQNQNLETIDTETHAMKRYRWHPHYIWRCDGDRFFLKHIWDKTPEFEIFYDGPVRKYGHHNMHMQAGHWDTDLEFKDD